MTSYNKNNQWETAIHFTIGQLQCILAYYIVCSHFYLALYFALYLWVCTVSGAFFLCYMFLVYINFDMYIILNTQHRFPFIEYRPCLFLDLRWVKFKWWWRYILMLYVIILFPVNSLNIIKKMSSLGRMEATGLRIL